MKTYAGGVIQRQVSDLPVGTMYQVADAYAWLTTWWIKLEPCHGLRAGYASVEMVPHRDYPGYEPDGWTVQCSALVRRTKTPDGTIQEEMT